MISGCVTVIGPPRAICSLNFGITLPDEPSTLPKRTAMKRVFGNSTVSDETTISAARLVAPITLVGLTALSVLISTKRSVPVRAAASAAWYVPMVLLRTAAAALCSSISGTCLYAAAWKTTCGFHARKTRSRLGRSLTSPISRTSSRSGNSCVSSCSIVYRLNSDNSTSTRREGR